MVRRLLGGGLVLLGTGWLCWRESRRGRWETERLHALAAALEQMAVCIRTQQRTLPWLLRQEARRPMAGPLFCAVLEGLDAGQALQVAWEKAFGSLTPPEAGQLLQRVSLQGDEARITGGLLAAAGQLTELARSREQARRQQEQLLWTAALSGAGLLVILLI